MYMSCIKTPKLTVQLDIVVREYHVLSDWCRYRSMMVD